MEEVIPESETINVFLRTNRKYAIIATFPKVIKCSELCERVSQKIKVQINQLILFSEGHRLDGQDKSISLRNQQIIHVINLLKVNRPELKLVFKLINAHSLQISVSSATVIRSVFMNKQLFGLSQKQAFLVYAGKPLNIFLTFAQQYVQNGSQISVVQFKNQQIAFINDHSMKVKQSLAQSTKLAVPGFYARDRSDLEKIMASKALKANKVTNPQQTAPIVVQVNIAPTEQEIIPKQEKYENNWSSKQNILQEVEKGQTAPGQVKAKDLLFGGKTNMDLQTENMYASLIEEYSWLQK